MVFPKGLQLNAASVFLFRLDHEKKEATEAEGGNFTKYREGYPMEQAVSPFLTRGTRNCHCRKPPWAFEIKLFEAF